MCLFLKIIREQIPNILFKKKEERNLCLYSEFC